MSGTKTRTQKFVSHKVMQSKFRLSQKKSGSSSYIHCSSKSSREGMYFSTKLPILPEVSTKFQLFLDGIERRESRNNKRMKRPSQKNGSLNAFMAFRAYHSRAVLKTSSQKLLSVALAEFWEEEEKGQAVWERYAAEYTLRKENIPFVAWLQRELGIDKEKFRLESEKEKKAATLESISSHINYKINAGSPKFQTSLAYAAGTTEDVFAAKGRNEKVVPLFEFRSFFNQVQGDEISGIISTGTTTINTRFCDSANYFIAGSQQ